MSTIALGSNTPEKNSTAAAGSFNPLVISGTVDGLGGRIEISADEQGNATLKIAGTNVAGEIILNLGDAEGQSLRIEKVQICLNGVPGSKYFLCSEFIPDP